MRMIQSSCSKNESLLSGTNTITIFYGVSSSLPKRKHMRVTLIHNPDAGDDEQPAGDRLVRLIRSKGHDVIYRSSKDNDWDSALKESSDIVAAAGGDGLVGKVAKRLVGRRTPIALLPMGNANNVARTLGRMEKPLEELVTGWTSARRKKF